MNTLNKIKYLKITVFGLVILALFMTYQIPSASIAKWLKIIMLTFSAFLVFVISGNPSEKKNRKLNIVLLIILIIVTVMYAIEPA